MSDSNMGDNTQPNAEMLANMMRIFQMMGAGPGGMPFPRTDKPPASQLAISELEDVEIDQRLLDKGVTQCAICTEDFKLKQDAKKMPCKHIFHDMCLLPWLNKNCTCPMCRFELPTLDADYEDNKRGRGPLNPWDDEDGGDNDRSSNAGSSSYNHMFL